MMKKAVRLALFAMAITGTGAACALAGSPAKALAEGEGEASSLAVETPSSEGTAESDKPSGESTSEKAPEKTDAEKEYDERLKDLEEKISYVKNWANDKWDTYIAPLLGGVSLAVVISFIGTLVINYAKGKGIDKKFSQSINLLNSKLADSESGLNAKFAESQETLNKAIAESRKQMDEKMALVEGKLAEATEALAKISETVVTLNSIRETVEKGEKVNEETKEKLESQVNSLSKAISEMGEEVGCLDSVKKAMVALAQIISVVASASDDAVKSGSVAEIKQLADMTKEL